MSSVQQLDYATPGRPPSWSKMSIASFAAGILSGPIGVACAILAARNSNPEREKELAAVMAIGVCSIISLVVAVISVVRVRGAGGSLRGARLAIASVIITCVWPILIAAWVWVLLTYCNG